MGNVQDYAGKLEKSKDNRQERPQIQDYADKLKSRYNIIFHGAPGTGKTYLAKQVAAYIVSGGRTDKYSDLDAKEKERVGFVQFHPSYDYTDFVEGLRPVPVNQNSNVSFELKDGIFKEFVDRARKDCRPSTNGGNVTSGNTSQASANNSNRVRLRMVDDFLQDSIKNNTKFERKLGGQISVRKLNPNTSAKTEERGNKIVLYNEDKGKKLDEGATYVYDKDLCKLLNNKDLSKLSNCKKDNEDLTIGTIASVLGKETNGPSSYYYALYNGFWDWAKKNGLDNSDDDSLTDQDKTEDGEYIEEPIEAGRKQPEEDKERQEEGKEQNADNKYVFIIDEINRGEISKILGELFFSIDPGYRGEKGSVDTQYANMHTDKDYKFYIPENVYIIGTMNDIDRSVDSFDFAMRRRFSFIEITADGQKGMLASLGNDKAEAEKRMTALNTAISNENELGSSYEVGPAYFNKVKDMNTTGNKWDDLWSDYIEPLLKEYVRGLDNDEEDMIEKFKEAYDS